MSQKFQKQLFKRESLFKEDKKKDYEKVSNINKQFLFYLYDENKISAAIAIFWILLNRYTSYQEYPYVCINKERGYILKCDFTYWKLEKLQKNICDLFNSDYFILQKKLEYQIVVFYDSNLQASLPKFPDLVIALNIEKREENYKIEFIYDTSIFNDDTISRYINNYKHAFSKNESHIQTKDINIISSDDRLIIDNANYKEHDFNPKRSYLSQFRENVSNYKNKTVYIEGSRNITYKDLDCISNYYANILLNQSNKYIGIYMKRDIETTIALISILKAGKCIVTINPTYPQERVEKIITQIGMDTIICCAKTYEIVSEWSCCKNIIEIQLNKRDVMNISFDQDEDDLCYIIFTSGSTGAPKGVKITHKNLLIEINWMQKCCNFDNSMKALHILNYSFDFGLFDILSTVLYGGCLFSISDRKSFADYVTFINENEITSINTTPSFFNIISNFGTMLPSLSNVHLGGEKVTYNMLNKYLKILNPMCKVINGYGPCECTVGCILHIVTEDEKKIENQVLSSVPIGKPTDNSRIYILDSYEQEVPINVIGEIYVAGESLSQGYVNPQDDIGHFIYVKSMGEKMYRTGDFGKWLPTGEVEFIGRKDTQVKLNGFRIELSEIDLYIGKLDEIKEVKTILSSKGGIVTFYTCHDDISLTKVKQTLRRELPYYMIPKKFVKLTEFPYLTSGKIDITKLKAYIS